MVKIKRRKLPERKSIHLGDTVLDDNSNASFPAFSLEHLCLKKYSLEKCDKNDKAALISTIAKLSKISWGTIQVSPRHGMGHEKINRDAIKANIPEHIGKDVNFLAFRFSGKKAMVGYRSKRLFYILWLDRNYDLYGHE